MKARPRYVPTRLTADGMAALLAMGPSPLSVYVLLCHLGAGLERGWTGSIEALRRAYGDASGHVPKWSSIDHCTMRLEIVGMLSRTAGGRVFSLSDTPTLRHSDTPTLGESEKGCASLRQVESISPTGGEPSTLREGEGEGCPLVPFSPLSHGMTDDAPQTAPPPTPPGGAPATPPAAVDEPDDRPVRSHAPPPHLAAAVDEVCGRVAVLPDVVDGDRAQRRREVLRVQRDALVAKGED